MSDLEINKQKKEYNTFLSACEFCKNNNVNIRTLSLMNYLNGIRVDRSKNDRPDIINRCSRGKTETVVWIEMFFVDQNSRLKKDNIILKLVRIILL